MRIFFQPPEEPKPPIEIPVRHRRRDLSFPTDIQEAFAHASEAHRNAKTEVDKAIIHTYIDGILDLHLKGTHE